MSEIEVRLLSKQFSYYEKQTGLGNSVKNLFHREKLYKDAVKEVSFEIQAGEMVGFIGSNGAGKTTTLKMLSGILFPTSGEARICGFVPWERKVEFKRNISIVMGQKNQLWWDLPASESFYLNKCIYEIDNKAYSQFLEELAELLDVKHLLNIQVRRLSLGERMKMELIAALIHRPRVLFLDEPTIGLDIMSQKKIRNFLKYYNEQYKSTILLTSHYMKDIEDLCRRAVVISKGAVVYDGELARINDVFRGKKLIRLQLSRQVELPVLKSFGELLETDGKSATFEVYRQNALQLTKSIQDNLPVEDFNIVDVPVEDGIAMLLQKG
ncbi:ABC transporter ATP-binding protein [Ruminiclostridium cellulolyticum]|uniref:ABC transporter related n=1 Tax=Ruminiclostridium cellulolyticum (strain ATCC 35319 / DSM 5812 / JCM 6584 / H10) TaxID=394503 RepID=B8I5E8_RUMCH|nr:ATP-binding cassette domain-containing protein [Ruminiclostridium cellulolyticum]ACL76684.1 ABC transporter related [Ruminiclostridium cellulolyticum H10]